MIVPAADRRGAHQVPAVHELDLRRLAGPGLRAVDHEHQDCVPDQLRSITSCANSMGMVVGNRLSMTTKPGGYAVNTPYDYVEAAITYTPATYWKVDRPRATRASRARLAAGTCAYGPDGQLISKVDLKAAAGPFTVPAGRTDCAGGTSCTLTEERQNFANWFQYYRKRHLLVKAALGNAYDGLHGLRAGFFLFRREHLGRCHACTTSTAAAARPTRPADRLRCIRTPADGGTPTRESMDYIGQQFKRTDSAAPITNYCQFNAGFVITDGFATTGGPTVTPTATTTARRHRQLILTTSSTTPNPTVVNDRALRGHILQHHGRHGDEDVHGEPASRPDCRSEACRWTSPM